MATTFNWIYLGTFGTQIDPTEGNTNAENASALVNQTFGSSTDPLYNHVTQVTMINNGGNATALDQDNNASNDQFSTNIGAGVQTFTFDASIIYNATVTYADGTTGTITAVIAQDTAGRLFLSPETVAAPAPDTAVYEAKPIVSIALTGITGGVTSYTGMGIDRTVTGFDDGYVEGTVGNDLINAAYVEPIANGSDRIDNGDGISGSGTSWQDDRVRAGDGNDTVLSGLGNDSVDGGTGTDSIDGGDGNDTLLGGAGAFSDTILGGLGNDSIDGGLGNDTVLGGAGADTILGMGGADSLDGGDGNDSIVGDDNSSVLSGGNDTIQGGLGNDTIDGGDRSDLLYGGDGNDVIEAGEEFNVGDADTVYGGAGNDLITDAEADSGSTDLFFGEAGNDTIIAGGGADTLDGGADDDSLSGGDGSDSILGGDGNDTLNGGAGADTMTGGLGSDRFLGITAGDVVDGSEDSPSNETDILDLFGSGWTKANTNIIFSPTNPENGTVQFLNNLGQVIGTMTFTNIETVVPCFTPGTMIETDRGPRAVETLKLGDMVRTMDHGLQPIRWIGRRDLSPADLALQPKLRPVLIRQGALGPGLPDRDMRVSPQHRLLMTGAHAELISGEAEALAPALYFVGQPGIVEDAAASGISYIHLMFDRHEIVQSDGLWSESFQPGTATMSGMDDAQRNEILSLFPGLPAGGALAYPAARSSLKRYEVQQILAS